MTPLSPIGLPQNKLHAHLTKILPLLFDQAVWFLLFVGLFVLVQFAFPGIADNDGYYHIKMAQLMHRQGLQPPFVWLPLTILNPAAFYDHHLLYHVYLAWFVNSTSSPAELIFGAKLGAVLMPALAFSAIHWLLRGQKVRWAGWWSLGLFAVSEAFLYRLSMPRAQAASLLVLVLSLHWLGQQHYRRLLIVGFVYVWLYNAFPLLLLVAGVYFVATLLTEHRWAWPALIYPLVGIGLGLLINPYFPQNLTFIWQHLAPKLGGSATAVGNEWYPYSSWHLVESSGLALLAFVLGALAWGWRGERITGPKLTAFLLSVVFGFLLFKARRFVEYYPAFALIFAALTIAPLLESAAATPWRQRLAPAFLLGILALPLIFTLQQAQAAMARSKPAGLYAAASDWLLAHTAPGSLVFQTDWDDFTRLFFYNTQNRYTLGLDPTYMELYDADLFATWLQISQGQTARPGRIIQQRFGGEYVFTDTAHTAFLRRAATDPYLREVYRDNEAVIFIVLPEAEGK